MILMWFLPIAEKLGQTLHGGQKRKYAIPNGPGILRPTGPLNPNNQESERYAQNPENRNTPHHQHFSN
jgi:hypothetical protein